MCNGMHMCVPVCTHTHTQNICDKIFKCTYIEINISNVTTHLNLLDFFTIFTLNSPIFAKFLTSFYVIVI